MLMAVIGNVLGEADLLSKALAAIDSEGIQTVAVIGDIVYSSAHPNEAIDLLRTRNCPIIGGERDRTVVSFTRKKNSLRKRLSGDEFDSIERTFNALRCENIEFLHGLPRHRIMNADGTDVFLCYGTPNGVNDLLQPDDDAPRLRRLRELANCPVIICGGGSEHFHRIIDLTLFVSPGSLPQYALIDTEEDPWRVDFLDVSTNT